ncbi:MAG: hypothetical protein ACO1RX_14385 [Candidatus Sericytochromatia bacterium]
MPYRSCKVILCLAVCSTFFLAGCSSGPQNTNILVTEATLPLSAEARLYSQGVRDSFEGLNNRDYARYAASFTADSPERAQLQTQYDLLSRDNGRLQLRTVEVLSAQAEEASLRVEQSLVQGSMTELGYYRYVMKKEGAQWKIHTHTPEPSQTEPSPSAPQASPVPVATATPTAVPLSLDAEVRAVIEANAKALNAQDKAAFLATFDTGAELAAVLPELVEQLFKTQTKYELLSMALAGQTPNSQKVEVKRKTTDNTGVIEQLIVYEVTRRDKAWKISKVTQIKSF